MNWNQLLSKDRFFESSKNKEMPHENDYDTIIRSTLFRRLQDKSQVFPLEEDDYVRTRLTHSLEVSAIGKKLGEYTFQKLRQVGTDSCFEELSEKEFSDILLCAGLIHDIGNPPFGHFGEFTIREWFQTHLKDLKLGNTYVIDLLSPEMISDLYFFEGNAQSLRILSKTPYMGKMEGFNLAYSVLAAMIKYPVASCELNGSNPQGYKKFGYNVSEHELFHAIDRATGLNGCRHPLSYLLEAADDIAYRTSDIEDAMVKKVITLVQILEALEEYGFIGVENENIKAEVGLRVCELKKIYQEELQNKNPKPELTAIQRWNQYMQEYMIMDGAKSFLNHYEAIMEGRFLGDLFDGTSSGHIMEAIARLCEQFVYTSSIKIKTELFGRRIIDSLLTQFMPAAIKYDTQEDMTYIDCRIIDTISKFNRSIYHAEKIGKSEAEKLYLRIRMVTDYIGGMTDNYAKRLYRELFS